MIHVLHGVIVIRLYIANLEKAYKIKRALARIVNDLQKENRMKERRKEGKNERWVDGWMEGREEGQMNG